MRPQSQIQDAQDGEDRWQATAVGAEADSMRLVCGVTMPKPKPPHPESTLAKMVQTQVYLTRKQHDEMARLCGGRSADFVRRGVDLALAEARGKG